MKIATQAKKTLTRFTPTQPQQQQQGQSQSGAFFFHVFLIATNLNLAELSVAIKQNDNSEGRSSFWGKAEFQRNIQHLKRKTHFSSPYFLFFFSFQDWTFHPRHGV